MAWGGIYLFNDKNSTNTNQEFKEDEATKKVLSEEGAQALGGEKLAKTIKAAEITSANLLMASQFDIATYRDTNVINSNFTLVAENLGMASAMVKDGKHYLDSSRKQFIKNNTTNNYRLRLNRQNMSYQAQSKSFNQNLKC